MSYVDLNPIRAGFATSFEESEFTSIRQRLVERAGRRDVMPAGAGAENVDANPIMTPVLAGFTASGKAPSDESLTMEIDADIELLNATGGAVGLPITKLLKSQWCVLRHP